MDIAKTMQAFVQGDNEKLASLIMQDAGFELTRLRSDIEWMRRHCDNINEERLQMQDKLIRACDLFENYVAGHADCKWCEESAKECIGDVAGCSKWKFNTKKYQDAVYGEEHENEHENEHNTAD